VRYWIALRLIRLGFALLDKDTHDEVLYLLGVAGRKGII
jgi:hypothetical protein